MIKFTPKQQKSLDDIAWEKGVVIEGEPDHRYEKTDSTPAKMYKHMRRNTDMAWEVDHIFPKVILEELNVPQNLIDHEDNLRPLHHSNNEAKGSLFPSYKKKVCWDANKQKNVPCNLNVTITPETIKKLQKLYAPYLGGKFLTDIAKEYNKR